MNVEQVTEHRPDTAKDSQTSHTTKQSAYSEVNRAYLICSKKSCSPPLVMAVSSLLRGEVSVQLDETASAKTKELGVSFYSSVSCSGPKHQWVERAL